MTPLQTKHDTLTWPSINEARHNTKNVSGALWFQVAGITLGAVVLAWIRLQDPQPYNLMLPDSLSGERIHHK